MHSMSQARIKEEGCGGFGEPCTKIVDLYGMKPSQFLLGRHPLIDALYWNPDMAIRE
jgi:hypothetical protein